MPHPRVTWSWAVTLAVAACAVVAASAGAHALTEYVNPTESVNDGGVRKCAATRATIADGNFNKGSARGHVYSNIGSACSIPDSKVAGNLKVKTQYWKKEGGNWDLCWGDGWHDNPNGAADFTRYHEWVNNQPCGQGYYRVEAWGGVKVNGNFIGTGVGVHTEPPHSV